MRHVLSGLVLALTLTAANDAAAQSVRRFPADTFWRRVWIAGAKDDGLFVEPRIVVTNGDRVTVLDKGTREVLSFDRKTGRTLLRLPARGIGPGEFKRPSHLVSAGTGFAVLDQASMRLSTFDLQGRLAWDIVLPDMLRVSDVCVLSPSRALVHYQRRDSSIVVFDSAGRRLSVRSVPWSVPRPSPIMFVHEAFLSPPSRDESCALVRYFGAEWAELPNGASNGAPIAVHRYVEPGAEPVVIRDDEPLDGRKPIPKNVPQVTETAPIAKGALLRGDTVIIVGARTKSDPHRLIDYYERTTGRYLYSRRLPFTFVSLAVDSEGTFFGTLIEENLQALVAFRPERLTKEVQRELDRARTVTPGPRDTAGRRPAPAPARPPANR
jgi:hypothetical protein